MTLPNQFVVLSFHSCGAMPNAFLKTLLKYNTPW
jgi:hypothetical protein